jgi:hypothetical protein
MADHLPECPPWVVITGNEADCICDRLRACETRVRESEACLSVCADRNYQRGLDAVREALELLPVSLIDDRFDPADERRYVLAVRLTTALAAIDALTEGEQT